MSARIERGGALKCTLWLYRSRALALQRGCEDGQLVLLLLDLGEFEFFEQNGRGHDRCRRRSTTKPDADVVLYRGGGAGHGDRPLPFQKVVSK